MIGPHGTQSFDPKTTMCQSPIRPRHLPHRLPYVQSPATSSCHIIVRSPHHPTRRLLTSSRATCHPSSGDTCHLRIGPTVHPKSQICLTRVITWSRHVSCTDLPRVLYGPDTWRLYGPTMSAYGRTKSASVRTIRTAQSAIFFSYLTFQTECDIFSIRTPFDKVNIPPESGRRDEHNGVGFIGFQALSFLSIFQALSGF
jgi:hypothetical protein